MKCLIVDDEHIARELLKEYASKVPELEVVATCKTALDAMSYIKREEIDILFLDIQMPDLTGLDFLKILPKKPYTILTTAYSEYAVQSYELDVVDYVLKPIDFDRFYKAVNKVFSLAETPRVMESKNRETDSKPERLFLKEEHKIVKVEFNDILMIKGQGAYVQVITKDGRKIMSLLSMSKLEEQLPNNFYRTHRSYIVNIDHIDSIDGNMIYLKKQSAVLSKIKRDEFLELIDELNLLGD